MCELSELCQLTPQDAVGSLSVKGAVVGLGPFFGVALTRNSRHSRKPPLELRIVSSLRDSYTNLRLPGTPVPGSGLSHPFGTAGAERLQARSRLMTQFENHLAAGFHRAVTAPTVLDFADGIPVRGLRAQHIQWELHARPSRPLRNARPQYLARARVRSEAGK